MTVFRHPIRGTLAAALVLSFMAMAQAADEDKKGCEKVTCPATNGEFSLHLPNPDSCTSFCKCDWGVAHYFECPAGLEFNAELQVCDWPDNAGCQDR
ncbi:carbohydrate-binding module family 14 protein [uncultured Thiodictyon sp.]|uniref:carbohydrate-binding module family 14 protein n=1 Tax=uncultured Thiodictyon sp. TaxID=1846217 RepID=UPI0025D05A25|nr:carbohydrate-binding module family 14 protein [uncultured Thiodictyon sp.]